MPIQDGTDPKLGTVGNMTYYKSDGQYRVKRKSSVSADRIAKDPRYKRVREHIAEFSTAGKAGQLLRASFVALTKNVTDRKVVGRLMKEMIRVVKSDALNLRGERTVTDGDLGLLKGFNFNDASSLNTVLHQKPTTSIDRVTGKMGINIPSFLTEKLLTAPFEASHFKIIVAAAEIDFKNSAYNMQQVASGDFPIRQPQIPIIDLSVTVTPNSTLPLFLVLAVEFSMEEHGKFYTLSNGIFNALEIVDVKAK